MAKLSLNLITGISMLLAFALILSACGRRGALEAPASATIVTTDEAGSPVKKTAPKPDRPFILDGLI